MDGVDSNGTKFFQETKEKAKEWSRMIIPKKNDEKIRNTFRKTITAALIPASAIKNLIDRITDKITVKDDAIKPQQTQTTQTQSTTNDDACSKLIERMKSADIKDKAAKNLGCALENKTMQIDGSVKNNQGALESINRAKTISYKDLQVIPAKDLKEAFKKKSETTSEQNLGNTQEEKFKKNLAKELKKIFNEKLKNIPEEDLKKILKEDLKTIPEEDLKKIFEKKLDSISYEELVNILEEDLKNISDGEWEKIVDTAGITTLLEGTQIIADLDGRINIQLIINGDTIVTTNEKTRNTNLQVLIGNIDKIHNETDFSKDTILRAIFMVPGQSLAGSFNALFTGFDGYTTKGFKTISTLTLSFNSNGTIKANYDTTGPIVNLLTTQTMPMAVTEQAVLSLNTKDEELEYKPVYEESKMILRSADIDKEGNITKLNDTPLLEIRATKAPEVKTVTSKSIISDLNNVKESIFELSKSSMPKSYKQHIDNANKIIDLVIKALK